MRSALPRCNLSPCIAEGIGSVSCPASTLLTAYFWLENRNKPNPFKREKARWSANWMMTVLVAHTMLARPSGA